MPLFTCNPPLVCCAALLLLPSALRGDALWSGTAGGAPMLRDAALKIRRIDGEKMFYDYRGKESAIDLDKITRLAIDDEPVLTAAEDAVAVEKWDAAIDNYQRVLRGAIAPNKAWMLQWSARRIAKAAEKTGRFDAAVSAYIARVQSENPSTVPRPQLPAEQSTYLNTAATELTSALSSNNKLSDEQRIALLSLLIDVHRSRRDSRAADQAANTLDELLAKDPNNPNAGRAIARRKLQAAQAAFDKKDFQQAINEIEATRAKFTDPGQQADALYLIAESKYQLAVASRDTGAWKDAALSFMRVVAHFKDAPDRPHVGQALSRTAQIFEQIGDPQSALRIYDQLVSQYPDDPAAATARQNAQRLRSGAASAPSTQKTTQPR